MNEISYTDEQFKIIQEISRHRNICPNMLVSAGAGTGKSFTIKEAFINYFTSCQYGIRDWKIDPTTQKIDYDSGMSYRHDALYLVFNRAMADYFKNLIKKVDIEISLVDNLWLSDIVDVKTYHSFLKGGENMQRALAQVGINDLNAVKINYAKSGLNKNDYIVIANKLTNSFFEKRILRYNQTDEETLKMLKSYSRSIRGEIEKFFNAYLKSDNVTYNIKGAHKAFVDAGLSYEDTPFKSCGVEYTLAKFCADNSITPEAVLAHEINKALDTAIKENELEISHTYYYKRIYEYAMKDDVFLRDIFRKYDLIVIDEAQDADAMIFNLIRKYMDIAREDECLKNKYFLAFGDPKQSIYKFNGSFNIFEWADENIFWFQHLTLTSSFRYGENIAKFGEKIAKHIHPNDRLIGNERVKDTIESKAFDNDALARAIIENYNKEASHKTDAKSRKNNTAIIFRTNSGCIDCFNELSKSLEKIITSEYPSTDFSADNVVLDPAIKRDLKGVYQKNIFSVVESDYVKNQIRKAYSILQPDFGGDMLNISMAVKDENVRKLLEKMPEYNYLVRYDEAFLEKYLNMRAKTNASVIITNVHQSKGKEYKNVIIGDDFFTRKNEYYCTDEEINIAHTAVTRAKNSILFYERDSNKNFLRYFHCKDESPSADTKIDQDFFSYKKKTEQAESNDSKITINNDIYDDQDESYTRNGDRVTFSFPQSIK